MFKKSNRNFRTKKAEFDSDEEESNNKQNESESTINVSKQVEIVVESKNNGKSISTTGTIKQNSIKVLSFNDGLEDDNGNDSENGVEFKVRKSKESRRIAREMKKSRREKEKPVNEPPKSSDNKNNNNNNNNNAEDILFNEGIKVKPLKIVKSETTISSTTSRNADQQKKYLMNRYKNEDSDEDFNNLSDKMIKSEDDSEEDRDETSDQESTQLKRLREEMEVLTGEDMIPVDDEKDETKRSMKLMLKSGIIPDANLIHAARKKREMARHGDYIPIGPDRSLQTKSKSRIIREDDENDLSEDESEQRVNMNFREKIHQERVETRNNFLAYEQGSDNEDAENEQSNHGNIESDNEEDKWEQEQIRKGFQISQTISQKLGSQLDFKDTRKEKMIGKLLHDNLDGEPMEYESSKQLDMDKIKNMPQVTFLTIKDSLRKNLESLRETNRAHLNEHNMTVENLNANKTDFEQLKKQKPLIEKQYIYFQDMKAYIRDFIDCYNEKMVEIEKTETSWLNLCKQRAERLLNRRLQDIKDQNLEATNTIATKKMVIDAEHQKRLNNRESRRAQRRKIRMENVNNQSDLYTCFGGLSSDDDDDKSAEENLFKKQKEEIVNQFKDKIFGDVAEDFYNINAIKERFQTWKSLNLSTYKNAYVLLSLPKLFSPLIRIELIDWNPLESDSNNNNIENTTWFNQLITYNKNDLNSTDDNDFMLIPYIIEKHILNKLIALIENNIYDPLSTSQTTRLTNLIKYLINNYPTINGQSENTKKLIQVTIARIKKCIDQVIFVPLYPRQIIEQKNHEASIYFHYQYWTCVKLFKNINKWYGILSDQMVKELTLDCILNRYLMIALQTMEPNIKTIIKIEYIVKYLPNKWLTISKEAKPANLPQSTNLINLIKRIADSINENEFKTRKLDLNAFKEQIKQIHKLFISLGATDQALNLLNQYNLN